MAYTKHTWAGAVPGPADPITAARLQNIEDGLDAVDALVDTYAAALPGTSGTPGGGNKYVTDADIRLAGASKYGIGHPSAHQVVQSGRVTSVSGSGSTSFPSAFGAAPVVVMTVELSGTNSYMILQAQPTTTGFSWAVREDDGSEEAASVNFHWIAIGT